MCLYQTKARKPKEENDLELLSEPFYVLVFDIYTIMWNQLSQSKVRDYRWQNKHHSYLDPKFPLWFHSFPTPLQSSEILQPTSSELRYFLVHVWKLNWWFENIEASTSAAALFWYIQNTLYCCGADLCNRLPVSENNAAVFNFLGKTAVPRVLEASRGRLHAFSVQRSASNGVSLLFVFHDWLQRV